MLPRFRALFPALALVATACGASDPGAHPLAPSSPALGGQTSPYVLPTAEGTTRRTTPAPRPEANLAEEARLDGYQLVFERVAWDYVTPNPTEQPVELKNGNFGVLSFGRRVIVDGKGARIVDRQEDPELQGVVMVPEHAGGGFVFVGKGASAYAKTFDGPLTPLEATGKGSGVSVFFGAHEALFIDSQLTAGDDEDDPPDTYTYVSLTDGHALRFPLGSVRNLTGTPSGKTLALSRDGELLYADGPQKPFRKLDLPRARQIDSVAEAFVVSDDQGTYTLDPTVDRAAMVAATFPRRWGKTHHPQQGYTTYLQGRRLDDGTVGAFQGSELSLRDRQGNELPQKATPVHGVAQDRYCEFVGQDGPLFFSCSTDKATTLHLLDPVSRVGKMERAFPRAKDASALSPIPGPTGLPAMRGRCTGEDSSVDVCIRGKDGVYRELHFLPALRALGFVHPDTPVDSIRYAASNGTMAASDDGRAALLLRRDEQLYVVLSDGRSRVFPLTAFPRRMRAAFHGRGELAWLMGDTVYGFIDGDATRYPLRRTYKKASSMPKRAVAFALPISGEPTAVEYDGFVARAGSRILRIGADGRSLLESLDLGRTFRTVPAPPGLAITAAEYEASRQDFCTELVCRMGPWIRTGWSNTPKAP